jgi:hypothetical protein
MIYKRPASLAVAAGIGAMLIATPAHARFGDGRGSVAALVVSLWRMLAISAASMAGFFGVAPLSADRRSSVDCSFHTGNSYRRSLLSLHSIPMALPTSRAASS